MKVSVFTNDYGELKLSNVFTALADQYLQNGKAIGFSSSGILTPYNSGYIGKLLFENITEQLYVGGVSGWLQLSRDDIITDTYATKIELNNASGYLQSGYIAADLALSGSLITSLNSVSGYLDTLMSSRDDALSGTLQATIYSTSGNIVDQLLDVSGYLKYEIDTDRYLTKEPTGFTNCENIDASYNQTDRTITLGGTAFSGFYHGAPISGLVSGWVSSPHATSPSGTLFLKYNSHGFEWQDTPWNFSELQIAYVCYKSNGTFCFAQRETHGFMPWQSHKEFHEVIGTHRISGGDFSGFTIDSTTDKKPDISLTVIDDEDLTTNIPALTTKVYTQAYISGSLASTIFGVSGAQIVPVNVNHPYFNEYTDGAWTQTPMTNKNYMSVWVITVPTTSDTRSQLFRYIFLQGQLQGSLASQRALTTLSLNLGDLHEISPEFVFIEKLIIRYIGGNWSIVEVETLTGNKANQVSSPGGLYLSSVSTDTTITGNGIAADPLSISGSLATVQTNLADASGTLNTKIDNVSGALFNQIWASGSIVTAIANASGAAVITASGGAVNVANTNTTNVSGALKDQIWVSGSIVTAISNASGAAVTNAVGQAQTIITNASGVLNTKIDNTSGTLNNKIWASGSIVTAIANASGAAVINASGGAVNVANTNTTNVSGALKAQIWTSGSIVTYIDNVSGTLNNKIWTSGSIVTAIANASGAAVINASGGAYNVSKTYTDNVSGALKAQIWTSGSIVTAIANASGAAVLTASGIANSLYLKQPTSNTVQMVYISGALAADYFTPGYTSISHGLGANYVKIIAYNILIHDSLYSLKVQPLNLYQSKEAADPRWYYDTHVNDSNFYIITASGSDRLNSATYDIVYWLRS